MNTKIDKELLFRYFSGMTTPLENAALEHWLEGEGSEEIFYLYLEKWERSNPQYLPEKDLVFSKFKGKLMPEGAPGRNLEGNAWYWRLAGLGRRWWGVAAAFILIAGGLIATKDRILYTSYATQYGETMTLVLDDDSRVVLNANTRLKVPRWMSFSDEREVWMTGEAFFNVTKKEDHRKFVVHTNNLSVEVLGTRFNVSDRRAATRVVLQEGKVKVTANNRVGEIAMLEEAGDYAEVSEESPEIITRTVDESLYTTWQEKRLKFDETPLPQVLQIIEDYYGVGVGSRDTTLYDRKFSGTLPNNDLTIILRALSNIYGSEFIKENQ